MINAFLIKVTEFFRDPDLFDYLREEVLPELIKEAREGEDQLRIWSAGCATGEEAYSLAILVFEEAQATVEELNTTNDDLQSRVTELQELAQSREDERQSTETGRRRAEELVEQLRSGRSRLEDILLNISDAELSTSGAESLLSDHQRGQLYLILREGVRNAVTHSGCRHLTVGLAMTPEEVAGYVEDDGRGFTSNGGSRDGLGLRSVKERAALLEGTAEVYSPLEGGAGVRARLPLRNGGG